MAGIRQIIEQEGTAELLRQIAVACAEYYEKHPQAVEMMIQERAEFRESVFPTHLMYRAETRAGLDDVVAAAIASGEFRQTEAKSVTNALADLIFGCAVNGCLEGDRRTLVDRMSQAIDVLLQGVVSPNTPQQSWTELPAAESGSPTSRVPNRRQ